MFDAPARGGTYVAPREEIDIDIRYIFKLVKLEDQGISKFADQANGQTFHNIAWHFNVAKQDTGEVIFDVDNNPWVHVEFTTSKTGKNPKNGMIAKARLWIEALLGHTVDDEEITADLPNMLIGKYGSGFFEQKEVDAQDGSTYTKLKILKLGPYRPKAKAEPKPEPVAAASASLSDVPF